MVNLGLSVAKIKEKLSSDDIIVREFTSAGICGALLYVDGMTDKLLLEQNVVSPLLCASKLDVTVEGLMATLSFGEQIKTVENDDEAAQSVADGDVIAAFDGAETFFVLSLKKFEHRAVVEPPTETVIKGPREGFNEEVKTNITLLR